MELGGGFVLYVLLLAELVGRATAATYVVGDNLGWNVPSSVDDYSSWASRHVFTPGDVLMFNFVTGEHDVAQVRKAAYDECSSNDPIVLSTVGPWNTTLNSTGEHYYICTFGRHCSLGQKLAINVTAPSPTPPPSPPMLPTPTPTPPPASTPPSPTPMSGSPSPIPPPTQMPRSPSPTPSSAPTPMSGSPSPTPSSAPTPMSGSPSSTPSPAPVPGSPGGSPSPGTPGGGAPTTPGGLSPPPGNSATLPTVGATLVVLVSVALGLIM